MRCGRNEEQLSLYFHNMTQLDLSIWTGMGSLTQGFAKFIVSGLAGNATLTTVDLSSLPIFDDGATALAEALSGNTTLTCLILSQTRIGDIGVRALMEDLECNNTLTALDLSYNHFSVDGTTAIARMLRKNTTLHSLNLAFCDIKSDGATLLAEGLISNSSLLSLSLESNCMGAIGQRQIGEMLLRNDTLKSLDLSNSNMFIGNCLEKALSQNRGLSHLNLAYNRLPCSTTKGMADMLRTNASLTELDLRGNLIPDKAGRVLCRGTPCQSESYFFTCGVLIRVVTANHRGHYC